MLFKFQVMFFFFFSDLWCMLQQLIIQIICFSGNLRISQMNRDILEERDNKIRTGPKRKKNTKIESFQCFKYQNFT